MTTEGHTDAMIAARRCWQAIAETQDEETRFSLWRAAKKYAERARGAGTAAGMRPPLARPERGSFAARECRLSDA